MKFRLDIQNSSASIFEQIVANRQYDSDFLKSDFSVMADMYLMKDLEKAAERIIKAIRHKQKIIIYGHDDLDGITSTYILFDFLENSGSQGHYYYIPNRLIENHGLQENFVRTVKEGNYDLVVTVDGGISSWEAIDQINALGVDVIITDHHLIPDRLPDCYAIVNNKQEDCTFPYTMLAGVGVTWYLCKMLSEKLSIPLKDKYLFWTAVGTIADKVPLDGLNRLIVKEVLDNWATYDNDILKSLSALLWSGSNYSSRKSIIRYLIKLLSNGRAANGEHKALYFMLNPMREKNKTLKILLDEMHVWEKKLRTTRTTIKKLQPNKTKFGFIYYDKDNLIDMECLGLAASMLTRDYKIPILLIKEKMDLLVCEARCTIGFNLMEMFYSLQDMLKQYGGHVKAAGFTMEPKNLKDFTDGFYKFCDVHQASILDQWKYSIDAVFTANQIEQFDQFLLDEYNQLQPFGQGNPDLIYLMQNFNPIRDNKKFKQKEMIFDGESEYDVVFQLNGSGIKVLEFFPSS